jgi:hypothetical protein
MDYRYQKLICRECGKRKRVCKCPQIKKPYWEDYHRLYDWCVAELFGSHCDSCPNRWECLTTKPVELTIV